MIGSAGFSAELCSEGGPESEKRVY